MTDECETWRFDSPDAFRAWLREHHDVSPGVWLAIAKKGSRTMPVTYAIYYRVQDAKRASLCPPGRRRARLPCAR